MKKEKKIHQGYNVRRFREILGIKQGALAIMLDMPQQTLSYKESAEVIDEPSLEKISKALKIPMNVIKQLNEDPANIILEHRIFEERNLYCEIKEIEGFVEETVANPQVENIEKLVRMYEKVTRVQQIKAEELKRDIEGINKLKEEMAVLKVQMEKVSDEKV